MVNFYQFLLISIEFDRQLLIFMDTGNAGGCNLQVAGCSLGL